jgi:hypothetical protein
MGFRPLRDQRGPRNGLSKSCPHPGRPKAWSCPKAERHGRSGRPQPKAHDFLPHEALCRRMATPLRARVWPWSSGCGFLGARSLGVLCAFGPGGPGRKRPHPKRAVSGPGLPVPRQPALARKGPSLAQGRSGARIAAGPQPKAHDFLCHRRPFSPKHRFLGRVLGPWAGSLCNQPGPAKGPVLPKGGAARA